MQLYVPYEMDLVVLKSINCFDSCIILFEVMVNFKRKIASFVCVCVCVAVFTWNEYSLQAKW